MTKIEQIVIDLENGMGLKESIERSGMDPNNAMEEYVKYCKEVLGDEELIESKFWEEEDQEYLRMIDWDCLIGE